MEKIKISRNSWHYRLITYCAENQDVPKTLCAYFWRLVFVVWFGLMLGVSLSYIVYAVGLMSVSPFITLGVQAFVGLPLEQTFFMYVLNGPVYTDLSTLTVLSFIPGIFIYIVFALVGFTIFYHSKTYINWENKKRKQQRRVATLPKTTTSTSTWGLILSRVKAWKYKVCPFIEIVDE